MIRKVVIIDDELWTREAILKLGQWSVLGLEVVGEAIDGETGMELIQRVMPDIVITDVRMPRISGTELVQWVREKGFQMPILIISGYDDFAYVRSALKFGVTDYLLKPVKAQELNQQLKRCVEQLGKLTSVQPKAIMQAGFFADGWEQQYYKIQRELETALLLGKPDKIEIQFQKLCGVVSAHEGEQPSTTVMIGIYYELMLLLQRYIETMGSTRDEVLQGENTIFVFGRDNTLSQMLDFIQTLYFSAIRIIEKKQQRTRLDISAVCRYLQENYMHGVTLEQTANVFHISKEYLSKEFKMNQKEGFSEYVTSLRMKRACELITQYHAPLKEVGAMVGYFDLAHFYKTFKKYYGKTPGEVRDSLKKDKKTTL